MSRTLQIAFYLLSLPAFSYAATYQWVDENGVTVYSQLPPPNQSDVRKVAPPPPPATAPEAAQDELRRLQQKLEDLREDRELQVSTQQKEAEKQRVRTENCRRARENLLVMQQRSRQLIKQSDGTYKRYTPEEKAQKVAEYEAMIERSCD
jgi:hypothetical protein